MKLFPFLDGKHGENADDPSNQRNYADSRKIKSQQPKISPAIRVKARAIVSYPVIHCKCRHRRRRKVERLRYKPPHVIIPQKRRIRDASGGNVLRSRD